MTLHINRVRDPLYVVYVRRRGGRKWWRVGRGSRQLALAASQMGRALATEPMAKRACVLLCEEPSYYDPVCVMEAKR